MSAAARRRHDPAGIIRVRPRSSSTGRGALATRFLCSIWSGEKNMRLRPRRQRLAGQHRPAGLHRAKIQRPRRNGDLLRQLPAGQRRPVPVPPARAGQHIAGTFPTHVPHAKKAPLREPSFFGAEIISVLPLRQLLRACL